MVFFTVDGPGYDTSYYAPYRGIIEQNYFVDCSGNEFRLSDCDIEVSPFFFPGLLGITCKNGTSFKAQQLNLTALFTIQMSLNKEK